MSATLAHNQIASSLFTWWDSVKPSEVATIYPGMKLDTSMTYEWIELSIDSWTRRPQRRSARERVRFVLTVRVFVRPGQDSGRVQELADFARAALSQSSFPLRDFDLSGTPVLGRIRLDEPEARDLSRMHLQGTGAALRQIQLTFRGTAEEI